jgi:hypothetical protein
MVLRSLTLCCADSAECHEARRCLVGRNEVMSRFTVLLHGTGVAMQSEPTGPKREHGFYVSCNVAAVEPEAAAQLALAELQRHPTYLALEAWPPSPSSNRPKLQVDSVDRLPFWRRPPMGTCSGFAFYVADGTSPPSETA